MPIPSVREYCYLGTCFTISGSLKANQTQLRKKGLRAYFSLKNTIDLSSIAKAAVFKLFDSLILPVVSYGCQVWLTKTELGSMSTCSSCYYCSSFVSGVEERYFSRHHDSQDLLFQWIICVVCVQSMHSLQLGTPAQSIIISL